MVSVEVLMQDGKKVLTHYVSNPKNFLSSMMEEMLKEEGDMVVGFDMEHTQVEGECRTQISLLSLCTSRTCILVDLKRLSKDPVEFRYISAFLSNKDVVFGCVHRRNDLANLKQDYGLEIRNVLDGSELVALERAPRGRMFFGVRKLASHYRVLKLQPRSTREVFFDWKPDLTTEEMECAAVDAYAAYKVTKYLLL